MKCCGGGACVRGSSAAYWCATARRVSIGYPPFLGIHHMVPPLSRACALPAWIYAASSFDLCGLYCAVNVSAAGPLEPCRAASLLSDSVPDAVATVWGGTAVDVPVL